MFDFNVSCISERCIESACFLILLSSTSERDRSSSAESQKGVIAIDFESQKGVIAIDFVQR